MNTTSENLSTKAEESVFLYTKKALKCRDVQKIDTAPNLNNTVTWKIKGVEKVSFVFHMEDGKAKSLIISIDTCVSGKVDITKQYFTNMTFVKKVYNLFKNKEIVMQYRMEKQKKQDRLIIEQIKAYLK